MQSNKPCVLDSTSTKAAPPYKLPVEKETILFTVKLEANRKKSVITFYSGHSRITVNQLEGLLAQF